MIKWRMIFQPEIFSNHPIYSHHYSRLRRNNDIYPFQAAFKSNQ
ncbi:hypothetical protein [Kingella sp. (in: b-proteobacteria)]|nr:hypothetical protein [Kingella sp. (in: b-proteobacteria)]MDO4656879.1 hypothetical protein [Kingella sp. (in: b-proteobacteria)]